MKASGECLALIQEFEGFSAKPYMCAGGHRTIGYGHVIKADEDFPRGISRKKAAALLAQDVCHAEQAVLRLLPVELTQGQFDALVSFTFNLGGGALQRSTLRRVLLRGEVSQAPRELRRWVFAGGKKLRGLVRRREAEIGLFVRGLQ